MTWPQHRLVIADTPVITNSNIPASFDDLSAQQLRTALFWDKAQRHMPEEGSPHQYARSL